MRLLAPRPASPGWAGGLALHGRLPATICPQRHPWLHQGEVTVTCQPWVGFSELPVSKRCLPAARPPIGISKRTTTATKNTKHQTTKTLDRTIPPATSEEPFLCWLRACAEPGCLGTAPSSTPWSRPMHSLGTLVSPALPSFWATLLGWCE